MNGEDKNFDNTEYDEESFDNESSLSEDGSILEEETSGEESLDEYTQDNSSIKSLANSTDDEQQSSSSEGIEVPLKQDLNNQKTRANNKKSQVFQKQQMQTKKVQQEVFQTDSFQSEDTNEHEIDESESEDNEEEELAKNLESLYIEHEECSLEVVVPKTDRNYTLENSEVQNMKMQTQRKKTYRTSESEMEFSISSRPPSLSSDKNIFNVQIIRKPSRSTPSIPQPRNYNRKSLSFSNERMREIERHNQILLRKILSQKPNRDSLNKKKEVPRFQHTTASAVNRKKQQRQIDLDNQILKRKIEAISLRRPPTF